jgi:hypothetical protein
VLAIIIAPVTDGFQLSARYSRQEFPAAAVLMPRQAPAIARHDLWRGLGEERGIEEAERIGFAAHRDVKLEREFQALEEGVISPPSATLPAPRAHRRRPLPALTHHIRRIPVACRRAAVRREGEPARDRGGRGSAQEARRRLRAALLALVQP